MPRRDEWQSRIKAVEREFSAIRLATNKFLEAARRDPLVLRGDVEPRDLERASDTLESTYLMRMFSEFETGLRLYWVAIRNTQPPMRDLLDGLAAQRAIPDDTHKDAHAVREYRNSLVHEREDDVEPIPISTARGHLCRFFSFLPLQW
jgi:hypothetical protein